MPAVGRNDPCPCGSGNKYKKCCLKLQSTSDLPAELQRALAWHQLDNEQTDQVMNWLRRAHPEWMHAAQDHIVKDAYVPQDTLAQFVLQFLLWHYVARDDDDGPVVLQYLLEKGRGLDKDWAIPC